MKSIIPQAHVENIPSSLVDQSGQLFTYNNKLYRGIRKPHGTFFSKLFQKGGLSAHLIDHIGFCPTTIAPIHIDGFDLVLEHKRIPFVTYAPEWPSEAYRRAAIFVCRAQLELLQHGLTLKDGHPWNVLFDGTHPRYVDWGSLENGTDCKVFMRELHDWWLLPLYLKSLGMNRAATFILYQNPTAASNTTEGRILAHATPPRRLRRRIAERLGIRERFRTFDNWVASQRLIHDSPLQALSRTIRALERLPLAGEKTEWTHYSSIDSTEQYDSENSWSDKSRNVARVLLEAQPRTVIDIGCNRGWYSILATRYAEHVLSVDIDEPSLNDLFRNTPAPQSNTIAHFDMAAPTAPHGIAHAFTAPMDRWNADFVLCLAVTHHLYFKRKMSFNQIAAVLASLTSKPGTLVVEFVPKDDKYVSQWMTDAHHGYTLTAFTNALSQHFANIHTTPSAPSPRILCVCTNKSQ